MSDIANLIRSHVASEISITETPGSIRIGTPMFYEDSDRCSFYLEGKGPHDWKLTDLGDVLARGGYQDVDLLSAGYRDRVQNTVSFYGMNLSDGCFEMPIGGKSLGDCVFVFAQACLELVHLASIPRQGKAPAERDDPARQDHRRAVS